MNSDHPSAAGLGAGPIGLYVHHHGRGHLSRALALIANLRSPATVLTSLSVERSELLGADLLRLPLDVPGSVAGDLPAPPGPPLRGLHYAPLGSAGLLERTAAICAWTREVRPSLLVVDVSSEVAALGRLLGLPVVVVRQHGLRDDPAHALACGVAVSLLAPFPKSLEDERTPEWVADRTFYSGGFSRFDGRAEALAPEPVPGRVAVLLGGGGPGSRSRRWRPPRGARPVGAGTFSVIRAGERTGDSRRTCVLRAGPGTTCSTSCVARRSLSPGPDTTR